MNLSHFFLIHTDRCCALLGRFLISFGFALFLSSFAELQMSVAYFNASLTLMLFALVLSAFTMFLLVKNSIATCTCGHNLENLSPAEVNEISTTAFREDFFALPTVPLVVISALALFPLAFVAHSQMMIFGAICVVFGLGSKMAQESGRAKIFEEDVRSKC